jgi:phi LC3 family holin
MVNYLERFKNTGTIISLVGFIGLLLNQFGVNIDLQWLNATINIVCSILVVLGICNNPHTSGLDLPKKDDKLE